MDPQLSSTTHFACCVQTWQLPSNLLGATNRTLGKPGSGSNVAMTERPAQLKEFKGDSFVDVRTAPAPPNQQPGTNGVYALTSRGMLLMLRATGKTLDKNVDLQVREHPTMWCLPPAGVQGDIHCTASSTPVLGGCSSDGHTLGHTPCPLQPLSGSCLGRM
jgi:hypothetical protein